MNAVVSENPGEKKLSFYLWAGFLAFVHLGVSFLLWPPWFEPLSQFSQSSILKKNLVFFVNTLIVASTLRYVTRQVGQELASRKELIETIELTRRADPKTRSAQKWKEVNDALDTLNSWVITGAVLLVGGLIIFSSIVEYVGYVMERPEDLLSWNTALEVFHLLIFDGSFLLVVVIFYYAGRLLSHWSDYNTLQHANKAIEDKSA